MSSTPSDPGVLTPWYEAYFFRRMQEKGSETASIIRSKEKPFDQKTLKDKVKRNPFDKKTLRRPQYIDVKLLRSKAEETLEELNTNTDCKWTYAHEKVIGRDILFVIFKAQERRKEQEPQSYPEHLPENNGFAGNAYTPIPNEPPQQAAPPNFNPAYGHNMQQPPQQQQQQQPHSANTSAPIPRGPTAPPPAAHGHPGHAHVHPGYTQPQQHPPAPMAFAPAPADPSPYVWPDMTPKNNNRQGQPSQPAAAQHPQGWSDWTPQSHHPAAGYAPAQNPQAWQEGAPRNRQPMHQPAHHGPQYDGSQGAHFYDARNHGGYVNEMPRPNPSYFGHENQGHGERNNIHRERHAPPPPAHPNSKARRQRYHRSDNNHDMTDDGATLDSFNVYRDGDCLSESSVDYESSCDDTDSFDPPVTFVKIKRGHKESTRKSRSAKTAAKDRPKTVGNGKQTVEQLADEYRQLRREVEAMRDKQRPRSNSPPATRAPPEADPRASAPTAAAAAAPSVNPSAVPSVAATYSATAPDGGHHFVTTPYPIMMPHMYPKDIPITISIRGEQPVHYEHHPRGRVRDFSRHPCSRSSSRSSHRHSSYDSHGHHDACYHGCHRHHCHHH